MARTIDWELVYAFIGMLTVGGLIGLAVYSHSAISFIGKAERNILYGAAILLFLSLMAYRIFTN